MSNDYLWDKTGNDSEIEKLEESLKAFRFEINEIPEIKNNVIPVKIVEKRKFIPNFRILAAGFAFASFLFVLGFYMFKSENEMVTIQPQKSISQVETVAVQSPKIEQSEIEKPSTNDKSEKRFFGSKVKNQFQIYTAQKSNFKYKPQAVKSQKTDKLNLSNEEKEAYDKLMLALSITSSKLKIVKDKVQNPDGQTAVHTELKK